MISTMQSSVVLHCCTTSSSDGVKERGSERYRRNKTAGTSVWAKRAQVGCVYEQVLQ